MCWDFRKAQASVLAVEERQSLDRFTREEKTASRTFAQLRDRQEELEQKRASLREDNDVYEAKKSDVRTFVRIEDVTLIHGPFS
jgi:structural maintenance of chromosome 1